MDLKCAIKSNWGRTQWASGFQIQIGLDGIARNVPPEAAERMLRNREVWTPLDGPAPAQKGILPTASFQHLAPPAAGKAAEPLFPATRSLLESIEDEKLRDLAGLFEVEVESLDRGGIIAEILGAADLQLSVQIDTLTKSLPEQDPSSASAEAASPVAVPGPDVDLSEAESEQASSVVAADVKTEADPSKAKRGKAKNGRSRGKKGKSNGAAAAPPPVAPEANNDDLIA